MKYAFLFLALLNTLHLSAQQPFATMVVGIETGWDLLLYDEGQKPRIIPNVHVEYPFGNISLGFGLAYKGFEETQYDFFAGGQRSGFIGEKKTRFYVLENRSIRPSYFSIPLRMSYRLLPCKCIYLYGGVSFDFLHPQTRAVDLGQTLVQNRPDKVQTSPDFFKDNYRTYEIGVGFKLHTSDYFRLVARPSYVWTENPELSGPNVIRSLRMTFGMQYAFVRYGGKR